VRLRWCWWLDLGLCRDSRWRRLWPSLTLLEASLRCHSLPHGVWSTVQFRGKPLILVIGRWRHGCVVFPLGGFVFGARHRQAGPVEGQGGCVGTPVVTMVVSSYVGDAALVVVVGSSPACSWVCLDLFVAVKSKLRWRVPVAYDDWQHDDWQQVVRSVIFYDASLAWLVLPYTTLCQSRSCVVFRW
jgi:hypothetical protein